MLGCCARAASGHAAAAPPSSDMNSRRFMGFPLLNCLVGNSEDAGPQCKAEHFRGLEVDHQLELRGLQNRQIRRLLTFENSAGVAPDLSKRIDFVWPVRHESAKLSEHARFP